MVSNQLRYFRIQIRPSLASFDCAANESLMQGAARCGLYLFSNCQKGECGTCKVRIKKGQLKLAPFSLSALNMQEIDADYTLACRSYPLTDTVILAELVGRVEARHYSRLE